MRGTIVIAGSRAQKPKRGGQSWVFLQYLLGFRCLGWDVLYLDTLEPEVCFDAEGQECSVEDSVNLRYFLTIMEEFGLTDSFALVCNKGERFIGLDRKEVLERVKDSAFLMNIMGFLADEEVMAHAPRRVFLDIDPGFGQIWFDLDLHDSFVGHDDFITIGENIGKSDCLIPTCGIEWIKTPQPVVLDYWPVSHYPGNHFTSLDSHSVPQN